jgi:hypothetical protein
MKYPDSGGLSARARLQRERLCFRAADMFAGGITAPELNPAEGGWMEL